MRRKGNANNVKNDSLTINIDWKNRFKGMHIDVSKGLVGKIKRVFRINYGRTKKDYEKFNVNVDNMIIRIVKVQSKYNKLVSAFEKQKKDYQDSYELAQNKAKEAEKDPNSLQYKIKIFMKEFNKLRADLTSQVNLSVSKIPKSTLDLNTRPSYTGKITQAINRFNANIRACRNILRKESDEKQRLNTMLLNIQSNI